MLLPPDPVYEEEKMEIHEEEKVMVEEESNMNINGEQVVEEPIYGSVR